MNTPDQPENAFGFDTLRSTAQDKIRKIRPTTPPSPPADMDALDQVAGHFGFVSREVPASDNTYVRRGRPRGPEAFQALNMRAPASLATAFRLWCEENRYSYPSGLAEIMRRAGIPTK